MLVKKNSKGQFEKGNGFIDLSGKRYGRLLVVKKSEKERNSRKTYWLCKCDCGKEKEVRSDSLTRGKQPTNSCGCLKKEQDIKNFNITNNHGMTNHPAFKRWNSMIDRCNNPKNQAYKNYGGRGIKVCKEWLDVKEFVSWSENNGFDNELTIERIDVNGDYEPSNCTWIPMSEQHYNKRSNVFHEYKGEKLTTMQWARKLSIPIHKVTNYKSKGIKFTDLIEDYYHNTEVNN